LFISFCVILQTRRAVQKDLIYIDEQRVMMVYLFPLNEIVVDFFDALKSLSSGYASFDYEDAGYQPADLVKVDILLNGKAVEELITIVPRIKPFRKDVLAKCYGGDITRKMKLLKRQAEGKKKMRRIGNVEVPKDAFIKVLKKQLDK
ncbi:translation factor GUF1, mitochondrial-like, partial [Protobothrops mucrosquamatus]|uniref:translation factor GUF1, mitochondrial-like n=1 Tax=Protobothrops mucrosquamatus TaxID=103944 RepID=UPI0010FB7B8C